MSFFLLTLIAPAMWAFANHVDKFIVSRYFNNASLGAMMVFSALIGVVVFPVAFVFQDDAVTIGALAACIIILNGCLYLVGVQLYLMALRISDASTAVPILQLTPVIAFIFAYLVLGETISRNQMLGGALVILGAVIISFERGEGGFRCRGDVLGLLSLSSLLFAVQYLLFKVFAIHTNFWTTMLWESVGFICFGMFLLIFIKPYRRDFFAVFARRGWATGVNLAGEVCNITGKIVFNYVSLLMPMTLAWIGVGFQPIFILVYSVILTLFFPRICEENVLGGHLVQKVASVGIMLVGACILNL
jgi:uncharacterized membrane protein